MGGRARREYVVRRIVMRILEIGTLYSTLAFGASFVALGLLLAIKISRYWEMMRGIR